jgi:hypothetical protein
MVQSSLTRTSVSGMEWTDISEGLTVGGRAALPCLIGACVLRRD